MGNRKCPADHNHYIMTLEMDKMIGKEVQLKVADSKQRDVGHGKVRMDNSTMQKLGVTAGDFVEIRGKKADCGYRMACLL
ncbi:hypothetical protein [[Eubacterium] cellulosolvens]